MFILSTCSSSFWISCSIEIEFCCVSIYHLYWSVYLISSCIAKLLYRKYLLLEEVCCSWNKTLTYSIWLAGDNRFAMRRILHIPNSHASTSEASAEKKVNRSKDSRAIRVGGARLVTDQRLDMPCQKSARNRVEAFRTTQSDLSLFMVPRLINELICSKWW